MFKNALFVATLAFGFSGFAQAEFIKGDWLVDGDEQATLDTRTGKEWLNLNNTKGMDLNDITQALEGELAGWRIAGFDEVLEMTFSHLELSGVSSMFWSPTLISDAKNGSATSYLPYIAFNRTIAKNFSDAFGGTESSFYGTYGYFLNDYKNEINTLISQYTTGPNNGMLTFKDLNYNNGAAGYSWWLVSDGGVSLSSINNPEININNPDASINDVSAPVYFGAFTFAMLGFAGFSRRSK